MSFTLLPAVDIANGLVARQSTEAGQGVLTDPVEVAREWQRQGAEWIHLVDLDAAFGTGSNSAAVAAVIEQVDAKVELAGGIRDQRTLDNALKFGCDRVVLACSALANLEWCAEVVAAHGERVAVGLDVFIETDQAGETTHRLAPRGISSETMALFDFGELWPAIERLDRAGCARYVLTDVTRDGQLNGPNTELYQAVVNATSTPVVASGGVASLADVGALGSCAAGSGQRLDGLILGSALLAGRFTLAEALVAVERSTSSLSIDGVVNVRDIGGLLVGDKSQVRVGRFIRAGDLSGVSIDGSRAFEALGLGQAIDLRSGSESKAHPVDVARIGGVPVHAVDVLGADLGGAVSSDLAAMYCSLLDHAGDRLVRVFELLADDDSNGATVVFCSMGKDRTGVVTALLLSLLGVSDEAIVADYAASGAQVAAQSVESMVAKLMASPLDDETKERMAATLASGEADEMMGSNPKFMAETLSHLHAKYGSAERYLLGQGLSADRVTRLTERFTAGPREVAAATFRAAVADRLAGEFADPALARSVVDRWNTAVLDALSAFVEPADVPTAELLNYHPQRTPLVAVDSMLAFAFGHRGEELGGVGPGPVNTAIALEMLRLLAQHPVHVYAQTAIADVLIENGYSDVTSLDSDVDENGKVVYLSTVGAAKKAMQLAAENGRQLGTVGLIGFADHLGRCVQSSLVAGLDAVVPEGYNAPADYDAESSQPWTTNRRAYLAMDVPARLVTATDSGI